MKIGYVILPGWNNLHKPWRFWIQDYLIRKYLGKVPKMKFPYDYSRSLEELSSEFSEAFNSFAKDMDRVVIFAHSAGGVIALNSLNMINFNGEIDIHTIATPLRGPRDSPPKDIGGLYEAIWNGIGKFKRPRSGISVTHHKTVKDSVLACGERTALEVQDNNIPGSREILYENTNHFTIIYRAMKSVLESEH